jgi:hypothetical protein
MYFLSDVLAYICWYLYNRPILSYKGLKNVILISSSPPWCRPSLSYYSRLYIYFSSCIRWPLKSTQPHIQWISGNLWLKESLTIRHHLLSKLRLREYYLHPRIRCHSTRTYLSTFPYEQAWPRAQCPVCILFCNFRKKHPETMWGKQCNRYVHLHNVTCSTGGRSG